MSEAFKQSGTAVGVECWRVEQLQPVSATANGQFYGGDAYVLLSTSQQGLSSALVHEIHFWIGKECSHDEAAGAAMLAVQLDNALSARGSDASISRHTHGTEGEALVALFPKGIKVIDGGVKGALKPTDEEKTAPKLYCVSGKRTFKVSSVPVEAASLNSRDAFVLDCGSEDMIVQWVNTNASPALKFKTLDLADELEQEYHAGNADIAIISPGEVETKASARFYEILGISDPASFKPTEPAADAGALTAKMWALEYTCTGSDAPSGWPLLGSGDPPRGEPGALLDATVESKTFHEVTAEPSAYMLSEDALVSLLSGSTLFMWTGKGVPLEFRNRVFELADDLKAANSLPADYSVEVVKQTLEGPLFTQHFPDWDNVQMEAAGVAKSISVKGEEAVKATARSPAVAARAVDFKAAASAPEPALVDDGSGTKQVWRIEKFELTEVPSEKHGQFTSGDCYIVLYTYGEPKKNVVYMWQGAESTVDERGACAICATQVDEQHCGGSAPQVRVVHGKEPAQFVGIWNGSMVVYDGGVASGFKNLQEDSSEGAADGATKLFQVKAVGKAPAYAAQVPCSAASLNSGDVFIAVAADKVYTWAGDSSTDEERTTAADVAQKLLEGAATREPVSVSEGEEPEDFWSAIGGQGEYAKIPEVAVQHPPRLFCISDTASGGQVVTAEEVLRFAQSDLLSSEVMLLDAFSEVFLWIGAESSVNEQKQADAAAAAFLTQFKRSADTPITTIKEGSEPPMFTAHFHAWDSDTKVRTAADYEKRVAEMKAKQAAGAPAAAEPEWAKPAEEAPAPVAAAAAAEPEPEAPPAAAEAPTEPAAEEPAAADEPPAKEGTAEPPKPPGKLKETIFTAADGEEKRENGGAVLATPTSATGPKRHIGISLQTPRGAEFDVNEVDPSGTKGSGNPLKYTPGQDVLDIDELKNMKGADGIDPERKEEYLSDEQFEEAFGTNKDAFAALPKWKRQQKKKAVGLF